MLATSLQKSRLKTAIIVATIGTTLITLPAIAVTQIVKPGQPILAAQFGSRVVQFENYTLGASFQDAVVKVGEPTRAEESQGTVHVFENGNSTPKASYQFPGAINAFKQVGAKVAMSSKWIAFTATNVFGQPENFFLPMQPAQVFIVGKNASGEWKTCPIPSGQVLADCTGNVDVNGQPNTGKVLKSIDFELTGSEIATGSTSSDTARNVVNQSIAISDKYLAIANTATGVVIIYRYDATQNQWLQDWRFDAPDDEKFGTSMAIEGDRIAISAPGALGGIGEFYTLHRDNINNFWSWQGSWRSADPNVQEFGKHLDMHSNRLVASGRTPSSITQGSLAFYKWETHGLFEHHTVATPDPVAAVSMNGILAAALFETPLTSASTYKLNTTVDKWVESNRTYVDQVSPFTKTDSDGAVNTHYFFPRSLDIHSGKIVFGWPAKPTPTVGLVGSLVLNTADSCLWDTNLLKGCNFDPMQNWSFTSFNGGSGSVNYSNRNMLVSINNPGTEPWHIQARYPLNLTKTGSYILSFTAKASAPRNLEVSLGHNGGSYANYGVKSVPLTTTTQYFSYQLDNVPTDTAARLDFNFGKAGNAQVTVDEVSLIPIVPNRF